MSAQTNAEEYSDNVCEGEHIASFTFLKHWQASVLSLRQEQEMMKMFVKEKQFMRQGTWVICDKSPWL